MTDELHYLPFVTAAASSFASAGFLGWWLSGRFRRVEDIQRAALDEHETKDERRHEDNLRRFEKMAVSLARLGNGGD